MLAIAFIYGHHVTNVQRHHDVLAYRPSTNLLSIAHDILILQRIVSCRVRTPHNEPLASLSVWSDTLRERERKQGRWSGRGIPVGTRRARVPRREQAGPELPPTTSPLPGFPWAESDATESVRDPCASLSMLFRKAQVNPNSHSPGGKQRIERPTLNLLFN